MVKALIIPAGDSLVIMAGPSLDGFKETDE